MQNATLTVKVKSKKNEAMNIASFELTSLDGSDLPPFTAGAHIDVHLAPGLVRQYSLCNSPSERHRYVIGVLRAPNSRGGSEFLHDIIRNGSRLSISMPRNNFPLAPTAKGSILFAGGIGITPILCMAEHLSNEGSPFELHYSARTPDRLAFSADILASPYADRTIFHFDDAAPEQALNPSEILRMPDAETHIYVCGPSGFIDHIVHAALTSGWPNDQIHFEHFAARGSHANATSFTVTLARSGTIIMVGENETVVQALSRNGVEIPVACEQGLCGTCMTGILGGVPDHRDHLLTATERASNACFLPCCSRALSANLILDL
ncbi:PDR/VanB family oxidoreductase [Hyphomicrobium sp. MC1]|uniref:PDR/VanB family oxidoreductase n=1 Tax=Hyphomicrobium sp. (strain MC1) TaxID=717785 RepID=UPI000213EDA0|nr:PDR/VanB family oxidoreductase [Hyphomicrobium sp. MC1]CCB66656.1 Vanillate O-demethylase oxidoreductase [Hyphomicrobium sp. MC1]